MANSIKVDVKLRSDSEDQWLETDDLEYTLEMDHPLNNGPFLEQVDLTREEYVALKLHLAELRGIKVEVEEEVTA